MEKSIVGIDISKRDFTVSLFENNKHKVPCFDNNFQGYKALLDWVNEMKSNPHLFCMEATAMLWLIFFIAIFKYVKTNYCI